MIAIREARELDVEAIRDIFVEVYGTHYVHPEYYDLQKLRRIIYDEDTLILVAEDTETRRILGTASVIFDIGAHGDLVGEFGRLAVHPDGRRSGIGKQLMAARLERASERLHVAVVENRAAHPISQKISAAAGFAAAGFLPLKFLLTERESIALYVRLFGDAVKLRRNNPRVIPEACLLAQLVLANCGIEPDVIPEAEAPAYPQERDFEIEEMTTTGYASVLRFERARMGQREIFGPARIHQGLLKLRSSHSTYIMAREKGQIVGAVGFAIDELDRTAIIFEAVSFDARPVRQLLESVMKRCTDGFGVEYIQTDASAYAPRMQRTLLEIGFLPVAYLPALAFLQAERCDAVRMVHVTEPVRLASAGLYETTRAVAEAVLRGFTVRELIPSVAEAVPRIDLFRDLTPEQVDALARLCLLQHFPEGQRVFDCGSMNERLFLLLGGSCSVHAMEGDRRHQVGVVVGGECLNETALLTPVPHQVEAVTNAPTDAAIIERDDLIALIRRRPDIGLVLFRNLAQSLGDKLRKLDTEISRSPSSAAP